MEEVAHIGDEENDIIQTEGLDHVCANHDAYADSKRVHDHKHNHGSLEAKLVGTHFDDGSARMIVMDPQLLGAVVKWMRCEGATKFGSCGGAGQSPVVGLDEKLSA